jgi:predicted transcriptional regulator of viral defense system
MKIDALKNKLFFTVQNVAEASGTTISSAHVLCSRYTKKGIFLRLKKNFYVLRDNWDRFETNDFLRLGNYLQVPSYASCSTALLFHGISTQVQQNWFEFIGTRRTTTVESNGTTFLYHKIQKSLFFGFERNEGIFVAQAEKAVLDAAYLEVLGRSALDWNAVAFSQLDTARLTELAQAFPERLKGAIFEKCGI